MSIKMKSYQQQQQQHHINNPPKKSSRCYLSLACSIGSISVACGGLLQLNSTSDRISLQRGLFLTSIGFVYFISLTDFLNKYFLETSQGIRFRKKYHLMISDVMDITNKIVSAIQAAFSCIAGFIVCKSSCSKSFLYASHCVMEAYAWFGTAYFMYDIWSMYKVHTQKISDKLKLMNITTKSTTATTSANNTTTIIGENCLPTTTIALTNGKFFNKQIICNNDQCQQYIKNDDNEKECENLISYIKQYNNDDNDNDDIDYGEVVEIPKDGRWDFLKYIITHPVMIIHHVFIGTFGLLVITYLRGGFGDCVYSFIYLMEFSTPFVSLRSILSTLGLKNTRLYIINGLTMLIAFFICRIIMWPYVFYWYSVAINRPFIQAIMGLPRGCKISILILFVPQIYWFSLMVKGAIKVLFTPKINKKENENLNQQDYKSKLNPKFPNGQTCFESFPPPPSPIISSDQNKKLMRDMKSPNQSRTLF